MELFKNIKILDFFRFVVIGLLLFSNAVYQNTIHQLLYYEIVSAIFIITVVYVLIKTLTPGKFMRVRLSRKFLIWILLLFSFYTFHYFLAPQNKEISVYSMLSQCVIVLCIILWLCDLEYEGAFDVFVFSASIASVVISLYYVYYSIGDVLLLNMRLGGVTDNVLSNINYTSQIVLMISSLSLYKIFFEKKYNKLYVIIFFIQFLFILLSGTKRAIISLPIFYIVFILIKNRRSFFKYILPLTIGLGLFIYLLLNNELLYNIAGERLEGMFYALGIVQDNKFDIGDNSTNIRKELFNTAIGMIPETPIWGRGLGYFETHSGLNTHVQIFHSHNNYLELYLCYGLIGFLMYYSIFFRTTIRLFRKKKKSTMVYLFLAYFLVLYVIIEPSSVTFYTLPIYYLYLYFAYLYSWKRDSNMPNPDIPVQKNQNQV